MAYQQQYPQQVVIQQPVMVQQTVGLRDWSTGMCGCFEDIGGCFYHMCCPLCHLATLSTRMNENCCAICVAPVAMRTKLRIENNIQGSVCSDFCMLAWCGDCVVLQMDRELKKMNR